MVEKMWVSVKLHWKGLLTFLGVATLLDIFKEYVRAKVMDWVVPQLAGVFQWIFNNPFALLTLSVALVVLWFVVGLIRELFSPKLASSLVDHNSKRIMLSQRNKPSKVVILVAIAVLLLITYGAYEYYASPKIKVEILGHMIGDIREVYPTATAMLHVKLTNMGPPTKTSNWKLAAQFKDGEKVRAEIFVDSPITTYADVGDPSIPDMYLPKTQWMPSDFISNKTRYQPLATGASEEGSIAFVFSGVTRDNLKEPGNVLTLEFDDQSGYTYETDYVVPVKSMPWRIKPRSEWTPNKP